MQRWMAATLGFAAAAAVTLTLEPGPIQAQEKKPPTEETIMTADGVKLRGLFHKSPKGDGTSPVVILLYPPGMDRDMTKPAGKWDGVINRLTERGFHVMQFDWRGHGKSKDINDPMAFWGNFYTGPWNARYVPGYGKKPLVSTIDAKTTKPPYLPAYVTDLAAVRAYLDQKNDQGDLNTSSIYLIGAEEAAAIGLLWMTAEWNRPAIHPVLPAGITYDRVPFPNVLVSIPAGQDIAGCIWLSASRPQNAPARLAQGWMRQAPRLRDNNPMLFLYGEGDAPAAKLADSFYNDVLVAQGNANLGIKKLEQTFLRAIPATKLSGLQLLGDNTKLGVEDLMMKYLDALQKERVSITRKERKYPAPYLIDLRFFGLAP